MPKEMEETPMGHDSSKYQIKKPRRRKDARVNLSSKKPTLQNSESQFKKDNIIINDDTEQYNYSMDSENDLASKNNSDKNIFK